MRGGGGGPRGTAAACSAWALLERRLWFCPSNCQVVAALDVEAAALLAAAFAVVVAALAFAAAVADATGADAATVGRAGAGSPRDSASSQRRALLPR